MSRKTYDEILATIAAAKAEGAIWNVEYGDLKLDVNRTYEAEKFEIGRTHIHGGSWQNLQAHEKVAWDLVPYEVRHAPGKLKKLKFDASSELIGKIDALFKRWIPVARGVEELKPLVKKGRKPNIVDKPSDDHLRHTCQICEGRYLGSKLKIAFHGFERPGVGYLIGDCFGASEPSFEVDREVLGRYIEAIKKKKVGVEATLSLFQKGEVTLVYHRDLIDPKTRQPVYEQVSTPRGVKSQHKQERVEVKPGDADYAKWRGIRIAETESEIRQLHNLITYQQGRYDRWTPKA